jgi:hypothetical protein
MYKYGLKNWGDKILLISLLSYVNVASGAGLRHSQSQVAAAN